MQSTKDLRVQRLTRASLLAAAVAGFAAWMFIAPPGLMGKLDAIGYAVCHRLDSHSLHIGGRQMPLCARCTGEFNAAAVALIFQAIVSPRQSRLPGRGMTGVLAALFVAFAIDGSNSYLALLKNTDPGTLGNLSGAELFNLAKDIGETNNLAASQPDKVRELADAWQQWSKQLAKPLWGPAAEGRGGLSGQSAPAATAGR